MVVQGHLLTSQTLSKTQRKPGGASAKASARAELCQPSCGHFHLLSSLTRVSKRWGSIFISCLLPADHDSSVNALCKLNLTSSILFRASFSFYRCFLLQEGRLMQPHFPNTNKPEWKVPLKALVLGAKSRNSGAVSLLEVHLRFARKSVGQGGTGGSGDNPLL